MIQRLTRIRWRVWIASVLGLLVLAAGSFLLLIRTEWFKAKVLEEIIARAESATGGRVEIAEYDLDPFDLRITIRGLTIRSRRNAAAPPFLSIPLFRLQLGITSLVRRQVYLRSMRIDSPEVRIEIAEDGSGNLPEFGSGPAGKPPTGELLDLAVGRLDLDRGSIYWNGSQHPISFSATEFHLRTLYERSLARYRAWLRLGESKVEVTDHRPLVSEAEAEFFIYRDQIEAPEIYLAAHDVQVFGSLKANQLQQPVIAANYQVKAAVPTWAAWLGASFVEKGEAEIDGEAQWSSSADTLDYEGRFHLTELTVESGQFGIGPILVAGDYAGDRSQLKVSNLAFSVLGGDFVGEASIQNLSAAETRRFEIEGDFDGLTLESLLWARRTKTAPPGPLPWKSALHGWLRAEGSGASDVKAAVSLIFARPAILNPEEIPLEGVVDISHDSASRAIALPRVDLSTPHTKIQASGTIAPDAHTALNLRADLESPDDLVALMGGLDRDIREIPVTLGGRAGFDGTLSGNPWTVPPAFTLRGEVEVRDFSVQGYDWKRFQGEIEFQPALLKLEQAQIEGEAGTADFSLSVEMDEGKLGPRGALQGEVEFRELSLARTLKTIGRQEPLTGKMRGILHLEGNVSEPEGSGRIEVIDGTAWGEPFERLRAEVQLDREKQVLKSLELARGQARLLLTGSLERANQRFHFETTGTGWRLEDVKTLTNNEQDPGGNLTFELKGSGRLLEGDDLFDELAVSGVVNLSDLSLGDERVGSFEGRIAAGQDSIRVDWQGDLQGGEVEGRADVLPSAGAPFSGECRFTKLGVVDLARLAKFQLADVSGDMDGRFTFSGKISRLEEFTAEGELTRLQITYSEIPELGRGYELWNPFPMRWSISEKTVKLDHMRLLGDGTDLELSGSVGFEERPHPVEISMAGAFSLAVLQSFAPDLRAAGSSTVEMTVRGTTDEPQVRGRMQIADGSLRHNDFPNGLSQVNGDLRFNDRQLRIEELTATSGGGNFRLTGTTELGAGEWHYRLVAEAEHVRFRYPEDVSTVLDGEFTFSGTNLQSLLSGEVVVNRVTISPRLELGYVIASLGEPTRTPASNAALVNMQLNVRVSSVPDLQIETSLVRNVDAEFDLRLAGTAVNPSLLGRVTITQGQVEFQGTRYEINRGDISFLNPFRIDPVVDFELESRIGNVDLALTLSGPARKMNLSYRSDPPLQFNEVATLVAVGRSPNQDPVLATQQRIQQQSLIQTGANTVLSQALSQPVNRGLQRFFGVSRLKVDPQVGGAEANPSARISTVQQITSDLRLTYSYDLSSAQQQVIEVEWAPTRQWSFIVTRDENGLVGADFLFRKRLR